MDFYISGRCPWRMILSISDLVSWCVVPWGVALTPPRHSSSVASGRAPFVYANMLSTTLVQYARPNREFALFVPL